MPELGGISTLRLSGEMLELCWHILPDLWAPRARGDIDGDFCGLRPPSNVPTPLRPKAPGRGRGGDKSPPRDWEIEDL